MSEQLAVMDRNQLVEILKPTEDLSHRDIDLGSTATRLTFRVEDDKYILCFGENQVPLTHQGLQDVARCVHLPKVFTDMCPAELLVHNLNYLYNITPGKIRVFLREGQGIGCSTSRTQYYSNLDLLEAAESTIGADHILGYHQVVTNLGYSNVAVVSDHKIEVGGHSRDEPDVIHGGIRIQNSILGERKIVIQPYMFRQWCSNGAIFQENMASWSHRDDGKRDIREWVRMSTDLAVKGLEHQFSHIQSLADKEIDNPTQALRSFFEKFGISVTVQQEIIAAASLNMQQRGNNSMTMYDLWSAVTYVGTHNNKSFDARVGLQMAASDLAQSDMDLCPHCHQILCNH